MTVRKYSPKDRDLAAWVQEVSAALNRERISFDYLAASAPYSLKVSNPTKPTAVMCLSAVPDDDTKRTESGLRVEWEWLGHTLKVHSLDVTDTTDDYSVILELRRD